MPISELIRDRKITPDQLAFPNQLNGGGAGRAITYQEQVSQYNTDIVTNITINEATDLVRGEVKHRNAAEKRAKASVGSWHGAWRYEIIASMTINYDVWTPIPYNTGNIYTSGEKTFSPAGAGHYAFQVTSDNEGVWHLSAMLAISLSPLTGATAARLGIFKNGGVYSVLDMADDDMTDGIDFVLKGSDNVALRAGDVVHFAVLVTVGTPGSEAVNAPTALYGYANGSRQSCDPRAVAPNYDGQGFTFV